MPTIPDARTINRGVASSEMSVARAPSDGGMGQAMRTLAGGIEDVVDAQAKYQFARAKADLAAGVVDIDTDNYRDVEYGEIENTYDDRFKSLRDKVSEGLTNPFARNAFNEYAGQKYNQGREKARGIAWKKEVDTERGAITNDLQRLREAGLRGDLLDATDSADTLISSGVEMGYFSEEEAVKVFDAWRQDAAVGKVNMMEPEDQISALNSEWAKNIPSDTRAKMLRAARDSSLAVRASVNVEGYLGKDLDRAQALEQADLITNDKLRIETKSRLNTEYDRMERNRDEIQSKSYEEAAKLIDGFGEDGEKHSYEELPKEMLEGLDQKYRTNLKKISEDRFNTKKTSDPDQILALDQAAVFASSTGDWSEYNELFREYGPQLASKDRNEYYIKALTKQLPTEAKSKMEDGAYLATVLARAGINDKTTKSKMLGEVAEWRLRYSEQNGGKQPSDRERQEFIDFKLLSRDMGWADFEKRMYERPVAETIKLMSERDPDGYETVREYLTQKLGRVPTNEQIIDLYASSGRKIPGDD